MLAAAAGIAIAAWAVAEWRPRRAATDLGPLIAAVGTDRLIEPRLSGGFRYGELPVRRGSADMSASPDVRIAAARIDKAADPADPRQLARRGVARLLDGRVAAATDDLASAAARLSGDPAVLSDYAAALLSAAHRDPARALSLRVEALDAASRATRLAPALPEAWFNRALAAELIPQGFGAIEAWTQYIDVDAASGWALEGRRHLQRLRERSGGASTRAVPESRRRFEVELLPKWAGAVAAGGDSSRISDELAAEARALAAAGDELPSGVLRTIQKLRGAPASTGRLAAAVLDFAAARGAYEQDRFAEAETNFRRAQAVFAQFDDPLSLSARFYLATIGYQRGQMQVAWDGIAALEPAARACRCSAVLVRVKWMQGLILANRGDLVGAIADYREAQTIAQRLGDREYEASVSSAMADGLRTLGEREQSWAFMHRALERMDAVPQAIRRHVLLLNAALFAERDGHLFAALHFHDAALAAARERGGPGPIVDSLTYRAAVLARVGDRAGASRAIEEASALLATVPDAGLRRFLEAALDQTKAETILDSDPETAARAAAAARAIFDEIEPERVPRLLLLHARAVRAAGRLAVADADLNEGIARFESYRVSLAEPDLRVSYFDVAWQLYAELADLRRQAGDPDGALRAAERGRSRSLTDGHVQRAADDPVRVALPSHAVAVEFLVLDARTIVWILQSSGREMRLIDVGRARLEALTADMLREIAEDRPPIGAEALYDLLIAPVAGVMPAGAALIVVPDGPLSRVPFAALRDRRDGRYLIEQRPVAIAPSLRLLRASAAPREALRRILIVNEPSAPNLPFLSAVARESAAIAHMYPEAVAFSGADATLTTLRARWADADVVHVAAHATANDEFPGYSRLFLAPDGARDGAVFPRDLAALPPSRARVVVLAACRSDAGPLFNGEGVISLARPLLALGIPAVVGAVWDVDDAATAALFEAFHRRLAAGDGAVDALRSAQLALAHSSDPALVRPRSWAGFRVIGFG